jgi:xanthine/uracil permease
MAVGARLNEDRSLAQLFRDLSTDMVTLLRHEIDLAKAEVSEKTSELGTMARSIGIGAGLAVGGALALLAALILGLTSLLSKGMSPWIAMWLGPLIVGLVLVGIGYAMVRSALNTNRQSLVPEKTAESLQENKEWLKAKIR